MGKLLRWIGVALMIVVAIVAALIIFGTCTPPSSRAVMAAFNGVDFSTLPKVEHYRARDGAALGYRRYASGATATPQPQVLVLIHGTSDSGLALHRLAQSLQGAGIATYVPELRGHGSSTPHGDIRYLGQLDDDLVDFVGVLRRLEGAAPLRLVGYSSGGGFALRIAAGPQATLFDRYLLLSPALTYRGPTVRPSPPGATGVRAFSVPYVPRLIGLAAANALGLHMFDGLPVVAFAVPPDSPVLTQTYSLRLLSNLVPADYLRSLAAIKQPTTIMIGDADEFSVAAEVARAVHGPRPDIPVRVLAGVQHLGLVIDPIAIGAIQEWASAK